MDCTAVAENLIAYQVGAIADEEREAIEAHLVGCRSCLEAYLAVKRAADRAVFERPRPEVKEKLRAEVEKMFPPKPKKRPVAFFGRRIPLYQGVALAAVAAAIAAVLPKVTAQLSHRTSEPPAVVDTSRTRAESLSIY